MPAIKAETSKKSFLIALAIIYVLILICNFLTPYQADDFVYHFSFADNEPLESLADIIPSMKAHALELNGRLVAHSIVQGFELMPKAVFNFINAALFVCLLLLMGKYLGVSGKLFPLLCLFAGLVVFVPAFGEVFFWFDGSINYLWGIVLNLVFLLPFYSLCFKGGKSALIVPLVFSVLGFFAGAYQETMSAVTIMLAFLMLVYAKFFKKEKVSALWILPVITAIVGLLFMATRPAEIGVKTYGFDLARIFNSFLNVSDFFETFALLICAFVFMFTLCVIAKRDIDTLVLSGMFFLAFFVANCMMVVAAIYPPRTASPAAIFLLLADGLLVKELFSMSCRKYLIALTAVLFAITAYNCVCGAVDIASVFAQYQANVNTINEHIASGDTEHIKLSSLYGNTKFSVAYEMGFPSGHEYINDYLARYFGVDSIVGEDYYVQYYGVKNPDRTIY